MEMSDPPRSARRPVDFDPPAYGGILRTGREAYAQFFDALQHGDESSLTSATTAGEPPAWAVERDRIMATLRPAHASIPLRALVLVAGNLTWGLLETFYGEPALRNDPGSPASAPLRDWYHTYESDFHALFPEQSVLRLPNREDWEHHDYERLPLELERLSHLFLTAEGSGKEAGAELVLGIFCREYAAELAPLSETLGFSLDMLVRACLAARSSPVPAEAVYSTFDEVCRSVEPSPTAMFVAFALTRGTQMFGAWNEDELLTIAKAESLPSPNRRSPFSVKRHANSDHASVEDHLGFEPLVRGLRDLLDDQRTELPLSIGVTAPWGAGKSSVMAQLRDLLERSRPPSGRTWIPIGFDAWKYERSERMWAALSRAIYEQGQAGWPWHRRALFRVRLEFRRHGRLRMLWGPAVLLALAAAVAIVLLLHFSTVAGLLTLAAVVLGLGAIPSLAWGALTDPFKRALDNYTQSPSYEEQLGFTSAAERDIRLLTEQFTEDPEAALIVFVDDLDRCSPNNLLEAIEAINQIFNAPQTGNCVFVLGLDRDLVTAGIEVAYAETIKKLPKPRRDNFGLRFLAKIVQLTVAVPTADEEAIGRLVQLPDVAMVDPAASDDTARPNPNTDGRNGDGATDSDPSGKPSLRSGDLHAGLLRRPGLAAPDFMPIAFDEDSPEFHQAERFALAHLERNPRDVKRFDNAFRLQLHVAANTPGCGLSFDQDELIALAKWVVIRLRWPSFATAIDSDVGLLSRLETAFNTMGDDGTFDSTGLPKDDLDWAAIPALQRLLTDRNSRSRIGHLHEQTFLRVS